MNSLAANSPSRARRCLLFVPGNRPERFDKARASGADMICIDLEDAVGPADKASARSHALRYAAEFISSQQELAIRINSLHTADGLSDLLACAAAEKPPALLMLAKVASAAEVEIAASVASKPTRLIALIETALGLERAFEIARAPRLDMLMLGGADYCAELGALMHAGSLHYARSRLAAAAASAGLACIDVPFLDTADDAALRAETEAVAMLGISCKSAIHPNQVASIQACLAPSDAAIAQAQRIVQAFKASPFAAVLVDNKLVDRPVLLSAERVLARAVFKAPQP
jgi:citrate lyase beta subunit